MREPNGECPTCRGCEGTRRKKLWEIHPRLHCSVIGTCLTLGDLRRIVTKLQVDVPAHTEDYQIHGMFVEAACRGGPAAKAMQKTLERRYDAAVRRFGKLRSDGELQEAWTRCLEDGDVPGPYWAILTHPKVSERLFWRSFEQVHMLSHLVGASGRANIRRLRALEGERDSVANELARAKRRLAERDRDVRRLVEQHAAEIRDLNARVQAARTAEPRRKAAEERVLELESGAVHRTLSSRLQDCQRRLDKESKRAEAARGRVAAQDREIRVLGETIDRLNEDLLAARREADSLETLLCSGLATSDRRQTAGLDLAGRRIVYVGGRNQLIPQFRTLVERANGVFIHHDGGLEEKFERLGDVLGRGDAVLCPVDCVSHNACQLAKRFCKQRAKTLVLLRTSSLSAFVGGLKQVACAPVAAIEPRPSPV